jgi:hypothetical protein
MNVIDGILSTLKDLGKRVSRIEAQGKPTWVYLTTPLTSTSFDGDAFSTTAATVIDLSSVFSVPAGIKAVLVRLEANDSVAHGTAGNYLAVGPSDTVYYELVCHVIGGDVKNSVTSPVACDANGDIYYRIVASGASTLDAKIEIFGYLI